MYREKIIYPIVAIVATVVMVVGCSGRKGWTPRQRAEAKEQLTEWREVAYLGAMSDAEFAAFTDQAVEMLESRYPSYLELIAMPMMGDSVEVVVVATVVSDIRSDSHNLRHLFPYRWLVQEGVLPDGLSRSEQADFYSCLAMRIELNYPSLSNFIWQAMWGTLDEQRLADMFASCAEPFCNM